MMSSIEANFDGLVGPTHAFEGLSYGNLASMASAGRRSNPRKGALQALEKAKKLYDLGLVQGILPPHPRPDIATLRSLGFSGSDYDVVQQAYNYSPHLLSQLSSSASMWAANSATVAPSIDTKDKRLHFTPANLQTNPHRAIEAAFTSQVLKSVFADSNTFVHHPPLPLGQWFSDEGAANHTRFCKTHGSIGIHLFVYGKETTVHNTPPCQYRYPPRQSLEASMAIARRHLLSMESLIFAHQSPEAIDAGVFHNDVISVGNESLFLYHEKSFVNTQKVVEEIAEKIGSNCNTSPTLINITSKELPIEDAVKSYLFNSQLVTLPSGMMHLICPEECLEISNAKNVINRILKEENPIEQVHFSSLNESMWNGGGPACLRLRVVLTEEEVNKVEGNVLMNDDLFADLTQWVKTHYRDRFQIEDLLDKEYLDSIHRALDGLTEILGLGSIYPFQLV
ncbi:N-succinylarginine dihydrolase [Simkania negevensis]|uniref:N-succinylarginine dihydrolase n=1 Tax=Simkania negevensis TaxID=83561 RepID=A0ABS3ARE0_9BACT|nr:N-succinylarginine dihydrolase [Simkania negevensis]